MRGRRPAMGGEESKLELRASDADTAGEAMEALGTSRALGLISQLPVDQAEAVVLRVVVGLDAKSAAPVLGKRPGRCGRPPTGDCGDSRSCWKQERRDLPAARPTVWPGRWPTGPGRAGAWPRAGHVAGPVV